MLIATVGLPGRTRNQARNGVRNRVRARGLTLVELLLSLSLGLILLAGLLSLYTALWRDQMQRVQRLRLQQELQAVLETMRQDLRRAGYWNSASRPNPPPGGNPWAGPNPFARLTLQPTLQGHCLVYRYDADGDGRLGAREVRGYRLAAGAVLHRTGGACREPRCDPCRSGRWWRISDPAVVEIRRLQFRILPGGGLEIVLAGVLQTRPGEALALRSILVQPNLAAAPASPHPEE